ncbi:MAG: response regulator transcription factor [Spartobacteria bacterium]|nr:response regulator transcription factor [Spartobacteria bacterium]
MRTNLRVLIADDDQTMRLILKKITGMLLMEVVGEAQNGEDAVTLYKEIKPDVMLLDINMPLKNGVAVLEELKGEFPEACIIMLTSFADKKIVQKCIQLGATNYVLKSNKAEKIKEILQETFEECF